MLPQKGESIWDIIDGVAQEDTALVWKAQKKSDQIAEDLKNIASKTKQKLDNWLGDAKTMIIVITASVFGLILVAQLIHCLMKRYSKNNQGEYQPPISVERDIPRFEERSVTFERPQFV